MTTSEFYNYAIRLSYRGEAYQGWQVQAHTDLTVQGQINLALAKIAKTEEVESLGASRTDSGVHALDQICRVSLPLDLPEYNLQMALNSHLPQDIRVHRVSKVGADFHPLRDCQGKKYWYLFSFEKTPNAVLSDRVVYFPYELNLEAMRAGAKTMISLRLAWVKSNCVSARRR